MFGSVQKNWGVWMRAVTVTAAVMVIVISALAISPEIDHHDPSTQPDIALVVDTDAVNIVSVQSVQSVPDTACHGGLSCVLAVMPSDSSAMTRFKSVQEFPRLMRVNPSRAGHLPFQPPRNLSQV